MQEYVLGIRLCLFSLCLCASVVQKKRSALDSLGRMIGFDDLEDVAIGIAEEEATKGGLTDWLDQLGAVAQQSSFQCREFRQRRREGDMPAELRFERRRREVGDFDQVQL